MNGPGPLRLKPLFLPKVWAAPDMAGDLGSVLGVGQGIGEVWLASDRSSVTPVAEGDPELVGMGLDRVMNLYGTWIKGSGASQGFPLLLKLLNVGEWLSVQVHPDDEAARRLENEPWGKTEAWLVLEALPGAEIILGVKPGHDRAAFERAIQQGRLPDLLAKVACNRDDVFYLPAGMVHATGPGLVIFEIQQPSDVTYRFYDWDRPGADGKLRPLHQEKALEVMTLNGPGRAESPVAQPGGPGRENTQLLKGSYFSLNKTSLTEDAFQIWADQIGLRVIFILEGRGGLGFPGGEYPELEVKPGQTWLLPAGLPSCKLTAKTGKMVYLESRV
ncbi:type I phosphomannose isomerase catalytic subunit [Dethiosulfatarculus sandiegensis]|uniref:Mannose-6-phosphate isomerase n=1 Tax=Dethiosulfatarculus sandiegensis TaxID=1429043 RepID=A0A0D2JH20_9BACT|nr:type I phosphomannose isomerase catalytic subunit [Dethiosulfatarculus sandiegensis]KIX15006.1 mannose-6-phosphate isomerase [Dethiosulfatarculus sandiegensis]